MANVIVNDIFGKQFEVDTSELKFRVSVYGLLIKDNQVLVQRVPVSKKYSLPGGAIKLGEQIPSALIREFKEETNVDIEVTELIGIKTSFFISFGHKYHNILLAYKVSPVSENYTLMSNHNDSTDIKFVPISELDNNLNDVFKYFIDLVFN